MRDDPSVVVLVTHAAGNHQQAWVELVERYPPLVRAMGIPSGSIGSQRARCLARLRQSPALATSGESMFSAGSPGGDHGA